MTGAFLAKEKYTVTVLEKNHIIGGGLQCFHRYGTVFETGMHILGGFMPGNNLHKICTYLGIIDKLHIRHTDADCMDSVTFGVNGKTYSLPRGREAFESYLVEQMLKGMEKTIMKDEDEKENAYLEQFGDLLYEEVSKSIAERNELGLAQQLFEAMKCERNAGML